jgi:hypothetical protein
MTVIALVVGIALAFVFLGWTRKQPDGGRRVYTRWAHAGCEPPRGRGTS